MCHPKPGAEETSIILTSYEVAVVTMMRNVDSVTGRHIAVPFMAIFDASLALEGGHTHVAQFSLSGFHDQTWACQCDFETNLRYGERLG